MLSLILAATVLVPSIDAVQVTRWLAGALVVALIATAVLLMQRERRAALSAPRLDRASWRMPPLAELPKPARTRARDIGLLVLRGYLLLTAVLVAVRFVQLAFGHGH